MAIEDDDDLAAFVDTDDFGSVVVYTPNGGSAGEPIAGLLVQSGALIVLGSDSPSHDGTRSRLGVRVSDLPDGSPAEGDTVTVDGVPFTIVPPFSTDLGFVWLMLEAIDG
jgi:hypothetical protein